MFPPLLEKLFYFYCHRLKISERWMGAKTKRNNLDRPRRIVVRELVEPSRVAAVPTPATISTQPPSEPLPAHPDASLGA